MTIRDKQGQVIIHGKVIIATLIDFLLSWLYQKCRYVLTMFKVLD